jgi:hypothetical protein
MDNHRGLHEAKKKKTKRKKRRKGFLMHTDLERVCVGSDRAQAANQQVAKRLRVRLRRIVQDKAGSEKNEKADEEEEEKEEEEVTMFERMHTSIHQFRSMAF